MTEIQEYLLKLTLEIDEICSEHNIEYVLFGGSSLGIERNEGFLPWDDDLDLLMTEENYHKFVKVMKEHPRPGRVFESPETNPEFPLHFGKYMSTESCGLIRTLAYGNSCGGIWIDIFYLCPLSKDPAEAKSMLEWFQVYCEFQNRRYAEIPVYVEGLAEKYDQAMKMSERLGYQKTLSWLENKFNYVKEVDCDKYFLHHALTPTVKVYSKRHMEHIIRRPFEGHMLPFSATNRELCREAYGDNWMMIPDIDAQDTHDAIIDTKVSYTAYQNDYMQMLDKDVIDEEMLFYKRTELLNKDIRHKPLKSIVKIHAMIDSEEQKTKLNSDKIISLAEDHKWNELEQMFADYTEVLSKKYYAIYSYYPKVDDRTAGIYLEMMIRYLGQWDIAEKILDGFDLPEIMEGRIRKLIDLCRAVSIARFDLQDSKMLEGLLTDYRSADSDQCREIDMAALDLACRRKNQEEIRRLLESDLRLYPEETEEMLLAKAILQKASGDSAAQETIARLFKTGKNGVFLLDVKRGVYEF